MGTADFAVPTLEECASHHEVLAVVTQPDRPGDRGRSAPRPVRDAAHRLGLRVLAPSRIRDTDSVDLVLDLGAEAIVVAAYGQILPPSLLDGPAHGAVNVHASLLPRWRGAAPVARAILAGDAETGVSIMRMDAGLDTGPVYAQARIAVRDDATTPVLTDALAQLGGELLIDVLAGVQTGDTTARPQPDEGVTTAPRLRREEGRLRWDGVSAADVDRHVRALQPWPGVVMSIAGAEVRIIDGVCVADDHNAEPGTVLRTEGEHAVVAARNGAYAVHHVLPPGSRRMTAAAFLRGRRLAS